MRRLVLAVFLTVTCVGQSDAHTLNLQFVAGQQHRYALHLVSSQTTDMNGVMQTAVVDLRAIATQNIRSVESDGAADVTITLSNVRVTTTVGGQSTEARLDASIPFEEINVAPDARVLTTNSESMPPTSPLGGANAAGAPIWAVLPGHAVKVGDAWTTSYDQANVLGPGTIHVITKSTYLRDENLNGVTAAVVDSAGDASLDFTMSSSKLSQTTYIQPPAARTGPVGAIQQATTLVAGTSIKGSTTSRVTTWIDISSHRVLKTQMTSKSEARISLLVSPFASMSGTSGPYTLSATEELDLAPA